LKLILIQQFNNNIFHNRLGNAEYRRANFDKAIEYYTKGLNYINDSPVLYVNRSLCYIKWVKSYIY